MFDLYTTYERPSAKGALEIETRVRKEEKRMALISAQLHKEERRSRHSSSPLQALLSSLLSFF